MVEWKDTTNFSRDDKERKPAVWSLDLGLLKLVVMSNHVHHRPNWAMHVRPFTNDAYACNAKTLDEAKAEALTFARTQINQLVDAIDSVASCPECQDRGYIEQGEGLVSLPCKCEK